MKNLIITFVSVSAFANALTLEDPKGSRQAFENGLKEARKVVSKQQATEKANTSAHEAAMKKADKEATALKTNVWKARSEQIACGNCYPPLKSYSSEKAAAAAKKSASKDKKKKSKSKGKKSASKGKKAKKDNKKKKANKSKTPKKGAKKSGSKNKKNKKGGKPAA